MKITGFEFILSTTALAQDAGGLFAAEWNYTGDNGKYTIRARIKDGINYVEMLQPDGSFYIIHINLEKVTFESVRLTSPKEKEAGVPIGLHLFIFEENEFPKEWQAPLHQFALDKLGAACEVKWDEKVIDLINCVNINFGLMFIIPNRAGLADEFLIRKDERAEEARITAKLNDCEYDRETTKLVEVWMACPRAGWFCENLEDHSPNVKDSDGNRYFIEFPRYIPETVLQKYQEGALEELVFPVGITKCTANHEPDDAYNEHHLTTIVNFNFIPAQSMTRYAFCGTFEDALKKVTSK